MALVRLFWAQLTSMRTALILLLVLALVAIVVLVWAGVAQ